MHVRTMALAFPLLLGAAACQTSSTQSEGRTAARDPMTRPGPSIKGHAEDQVVDGRIARVSGQSISIESDRGGMQVLDLAPETVIRVDGEDAARTDLREGQPVRASFSEVEGRDVAVEIRAGRDVEEEPRSQSPYPPGRSPTPAPADVPPGTR